MSKVNNIFDLIESGIRAESLRQKTIGNNVANLNTPGYRRKDVNFTLLNTEEEYSIAKSLLDYPRQIKLAAESYEPSVISSYLLDLCGNFNRLYQKERIITSDEVSTQARMLLVSGIQPVVKSGLAILGIKAPERM